MTELFSIQANGLVSWNSKLRSGQLELDDKTLFPLPPLNRKFSKGRGVSLANLQGWTTKKKIRARPNRCGMFLLKTLTVYL